ncbi:MAG: SprT-like domain-containing protein [Cryomorphaceae bacterium]|nr:SprT-like domain-containing protein [Cryomorphaceae bacterium]
MIKNLDALKPFLPDNTLPLLQPLMNKYPLSIKVVNPRKRKLGDYRRAVPPSQVHQITVNNNLDSVQFLITLVHELAHLHAFETYGYRIKPHGKEWKHTYASMLKPFVPYVPTDKQAEVIDQVQKPRATTTPVDFEERIAEQERAGGVKLKSLPTGAVFTTHHGMRMQTIRPLRTYILCKDLGSKRLYRVHGMAVVKPL